MAKSYQSFLMNMNWWKRCQFKITFEEVQFSVMILNNVVKLLSVINESVLFEIAARLE